MGMLDSLQTGLLAEGIFDLLGPLLIFGIYIIASIVKAVAQKEKKDDSGEESGSTLKEAVRRRYQEIYQRQTGQSTPKQQQSPKPQPYMQPASTQEPDIRTLQAKSEWQRRQEETRQRNFRIQERQPIAVQKQRRKEQSRVAASAKRPTAQTVKPLAFKQVPQKRPLRTAKTAQTKICPQTRNILADMISNPKNLQTAFVLKEILDKPIALRSDF